MKKTVSFIAMWIYIISASAHTDLPALPSQISFRDTIYVYETVIVYDTIVIRDTIRVKKAINIPAVPSKNIDVLFTPIYSTKTDLAILTSPTDANIFSQPTATFSENNIIYHENDHKKNVNIMNMNNSKRKSVKKSFDWNLTGYLGATLLAVQSVTGMMAQETDPTVKETLPLMPMQISIAYPITTMGDQTVNYRYSLSFNLFSGKVGAVRGVEFGTIFNHVEHDMRGVQFGGIGNRTRELNGIQFAGIMNTATTVQGIQLGGIMNVSEDVYGIQYGGIANFADTVRGLQFGEIINYCKKMDGIQFGGVANVTESVKGVQFAGITNLSEKSDGVQFAGIANITRESSGISIAGIYNHSETLQGVQIGGILSITDTIEKGVSIALINIVKKGAYKEWSLNFADYMNAGLGFKLGIPKFYTIFTIGANFLEDKMWISGIGFGNRTPLSPRFDFQPEIVGYQYYPWNFKEVHHLSSTHLKIGFVYKLNDRLGISVAPSIYLLNGDVRRTERVGSIPPFIEWERNYSQHDQYVDIEDDFRHSFGAGISVGLLFH